MFFFCDRYSIYLNLVTSCHFDIINRHFDFNYVYVGIDLETDSADDDKFLRSSFMGPFWTLSLCIKKKQNQHKT